MKKFLPLVLLVLISWSSSGQGTPDTIPFNPTEFRAIVARFKQEPLVPEKIVFLGNSITEGGDWKRLLNDSTVINRGISGDLTYGVLYRIDEVVKRKPSKLFLLIGINDISRGISDEVIMENIFSIVSHIKRGSPKTGIFVQSILPTNNAFPAFPKHKNKDEHVVTLNGQLKKYGDRLGYTFVDLYSGFLDSQSRLDAKYTTDGLHLNNAGYVHWVEVLKSLKHL